MAQRRSKVQRSRSGRRRSQAAEGKDHHKHVGFYMAALASLALFLTLPSFLATNATGFVVFAREPLNLVPDKGPVILTAMLILVAVFIILIAGLEKAEEREREQGRR